MLRRRRRHRCYKTYPSPFEGSLRAQVLFSPEPFPICCRQRCFQTPTCIWITITVEMQIRRLTVLFLYCLTVLLTAVKGYNNDRGSEESTFKTYLRYGRSSSKKKEDLPKVVPRSRSFYSGTRYGKRSSPINVNANLSENDHRLSCSWIGFSDLYRCTPRKQSLVN